MLMHAASVYFPGGDVPDRGEAGGLAGNARGATESEGRDKAADATADGGIGAAATTSASGAAVCGASCFRPLPGGVVMFDMIDFLAPFL